MTDENKTIGRPGSAGTPSEGNPGPVEEVSIPDYVMLDFADDFFPDEVAPSRLRKPHAPPELFAVERLALLTGSKPSILSQRVCSEVEPRHYEHPPAFAQEVFSEEKHALTVGVVQ